MAMAPRISEKNTLPKDSRKRMTADWPDTTFSSQLRSIQSFSNVALRLRVPKQVQEWRSAGRGCRFSLRCRARTPNIWAICNDQERLAMHRNPLREITTRLRFPEGPVALGDGSVLVVE